MGLLDKLKKKKDAPVQPKPTIDLDEALVDGIQFEIKIETSQPLDPEFEKQAEAGFQKMLEDEANSTNPKFHRTEQEEDLSFAFWDKYGDQLDAKCDKFQDLLRDASLQDTPEAEIKKIEAAIAAFDKARDWAYSKGRGGEIYFQDMWEHMHSNDDPDYSYRSYMTGLIRDIQVREQQKAEFRRMLEETLTREPGTLQSGIYDLTDLDKDSCRYYLKQYEADGLIRRVKHGRSYELYWEGKTKR